MFNRGPFNRAHFNNPYVSEVSFSASLSGVGSIQPAFTLQMVSKSSMSGNGTLSGNFTREYVFSFTSSGSGSLNANYIREILNSIAMSGIGSININFHRYHLYLLQFTGDFVPGDKIVIDSNPMKMTITKNGVNVYSQMLGDFFNIQPGDNTVKYADSESGRTVLMRVSNRDRFFY